MNNLPDILSIWDAKIDFESLRAAAIKKNQSLSQAAEPVLKVIEDPAVVDRLKGAIDKERNMELLEKEYSVGCRVVAID